MKRKIKCGNKECQDLIIVTIEGDVNRDYVEVMCSKCGDINRVSIIRLKEREDLKV